jgi:hypothetical protein
LDLFRLGPIFVPFSRQGYPSTREEGAGTRSGKGTEGYKSALSKLPKKGSRGERRECDLSSAKGGGYEVVQGDGKKKIKKKKKWAFL